MVVQLRLGSTLVIPSLPSLGLLTNKPGICEAVLLHEPLKVVGEFHGGYPMGQYSIQVPESGKSKDSFSITLHTMKPHSPQFGRHPTRIYPGYLWPRETEVNGKLGRYITFCLNGERVRSYSVSVGDVANHVNLTCTDMEEDRLAGVSASNPIVGLIAKWNDLHIPVPLRPPLRRTPAAHRGGRRARKPYIHRQ